MLRLQDVGNRIDGFVMDEKRAEKRLLSLQVVRRRASVADAIPDGLRH